MPNEVNLGSRVVLDPPARRRTGGYLPMLAAVLSVGGAAWAWDRDIARLSWGRLFGK